MKTLQLSARTVGALNDPGLCPGCYWIQVRARNLPFQIPMPGVFASIDSYTKNLIHGSLESQGRLPAWVPKVGDVRSYVPKLHYSWFQCHDPETAITLTGVPDDIFALADGDFHIVDYKTARITGGQDALLPLYEGQLNAYAYIAERLTKRDPLTPVSGLSLVYFEPQTAVDDDLVLTLSDGDGLPLQFAPKRRPVQLRAEELIPALLGRARGLLDLEMVPDHKDGCKDALLLDQLLDLVRG